MIDIVSLDFSPRKMLLIVPRNDVTGIHLQMRSSAKEIRRTLLYFWILHYSFTSKSDRGSLSLEFELQLLFAIFIPGNSII